MVLWRDRWDDTPGIVVLAYDDLQNGVLEDAVLMIRDDLTAVPVDVFDEQGQRFRLLLPDTYLDAEAPIVNVGLDLDVETP